MYFPKAFGKIIFLSFEGIQIPHKEKRKKNRIKVAPKLCSMHFYFRKLLLL